MDFFWLRVAMIPEHSCWEWTGQKTAAGYGQFKGKYAHRLSYEMNKGPIPKGMFVCHHCDNPGCVRPEHLFLGTNKDNMRDMVSKKRSHKGYKLKKSDISKIFKLRAKSHTEIAKKFGVSRRLIGLILKGERWNL